MKANGIASAIIRNVEYVFFLVPALVIEEIRALSRIMLSGEFDAF